MLSARHADLWIGQTLESPKEAHPCVTSTANVFRVSRIQVSMALFELYTAGFPKTRKKCITNFSAHLLPGYQNKAAPTAWHLQPG